MEKDDVILAKISIVRNCLKSIEQVDLVYQSIKNRIKILGEWFGGPGYDKKCYFESRSNSCQNC